MESTEHKIVILNYTEYPGPRYCIQGDHSGEDFYHDILNEAFENAVSKGFKLIIDLDGTAGYASSFLDEAFGNLVYDFSFTVVEPNIVIISNQEPDWIDMIKTKVLIDWERRRISNDPPTKTASHHEWYRKINQDYVKKVWLEKQ